MSPNERTDPAQFAIGRTPRERMLWEDLKQVLREQAIAEVRDEVFFWAHELDAIEGVLPSVDDLIRRIQEDADDAA